MKAIRQAFTETLLALAHQNPKLAALATDSRGSVTLTEFAEQLPQQFVECGIAEQDAVGIAAGLANAGYIPFVCGPACFFSLRSAEQIKTDVAYSGSNVKIIGVSGGVSYGILGATHHAVQDIALMRAIPDIEIFLPADAEQMRALTAYLARSGRPAYVRMGRAAVPDVYPEGQTFTPGRAMQVTEGNDVSILACGEMVYTAVQTAKLLRQRGISASVWDFFSIRPLDTQALMQAAEAPLVVTLEEHSVHGGLGGAAAEVLIQRKPIRMVILGLPDETLYHGDSADIKAHYGLDAEGVAQRVARELTL